MSFIPSPEFGPFIKHFRASKGLSLKEVQEITDIDTKTLGRWERGKVQRIRHSTLKPFAEKLFNLTVEDFINEFEAHKKSIAFDTAQTTTCPPGNDETVASMPRNPTEATGPSRNKWKLISKVVLGLVIAALLVFAVYALIISPRIQSSVKPVIIAGKVLCAKSEPVVNIWLDVFKGSNIDKGISGYADLRTPNSNGSEVAFVYVLKGDAYNLHVGCGGSKQHWKGVYITETGSGPVHDYEFHYFICHDVPPAIDYGSCELQY